MSDNPYNTPSSGSEEVPVAAAVIGDGAGSWVERQQSFLGHPPGLFVLFFAEMWERFSYYGMRALLVFYMIKGFLGYGDSQAYSVYGAYTALVYMTPFFGGLIADRYLGPRIAVVIGGILMSAGHLLMTVEQTDFFFFALALLITGNGFFKPNISTIVGSLYPADSVKRDGGFTIFYIGINLGAAMSPLLCGYIGETYGWHYGFGLATVGMLLGLGVFVMPTRASQILILIGAGLAAVGLFVFHPTNLIATLINYAVGASLLIGGVLSVIALTKGGLPDEAGRPHHGVRLRSNLIRILILTAIAIPVFALLVSGFSTFNDGKPVTLIAEETIESFGTEGLGAIAGIFLSEISKPAGLVLSVTGILAFGFLILQTFSLERVARERMFVVLILTFFSMLFWSFFEQAGSSLNNFTDRNIDRVSENRVVTAEEVGTTIEIQPTQEQLGYQNGDQIFTLSDLDALRAENSENPGFTMNWEVVESNVGMGIATRDDEIAASVFQAVNPGCILVFGLVFTAIWTILGRLNLEPNTAVKFALGLIQLGLGFGMFWYGASVATDRGMVAVVWLVLGYAFQTTGELCLSPVGLSMVTKLSPKYLVSTVMGGWFLATAFSQYLAAMISQLTGVGEGGEEGVVPIPAETVDVYGGVFGKIAIAALISGFLCLILSPLLSHWMHADQLGEGEKKASPTG